MFEHKVLLTSILVNQSVKLVQTICVPQTFMPFLLDVLCSIVVSLVRACSQKILAQISPLMFPGYQNCSCG